MICIKDQIKDNVTMSLMLLDINDMLNFFQPSVCWNAVLTMVFPKGVWDKTSIRKPLLPIINLIWWSKPWLQKIAKSIKA